MPRNPALDKERVPIGNMSLNGCFRLVRLRGETCRIIGIVSDLSGESAKSLPVALPGE